jgi:hypothetical protein
MWRYRASTNPKISSPRTKTLSTDCRGCEERGAGLRSPSLAIAVGGRLAHYDEGLQRGLAPSLTHEP